MLLIADGGIGPGTKITGPFRAASATAHSFLAGFVSFEDFLGSRMKKLELGNQQKKALRF